MSKLLEFIVNKKHREYRTVYDYDFAGEYSRMGLPYEERVARMFETLCDMEKAVLLPDEKICFMRTVVCSNVLITPEEKEASRNGKCHEYIHEFSHVSNICPDYAYVLENGLEALKSKTDGYGVRMIDAILRLTEKYRKAAKDANDTELEKILSIVPAKPAYSFRSALQFHRIITFALRLEGTNHVTNGRFDKYMLPYYEKDINEGVITKDEAYELIRDFFISFNKDSDFYKGVQQGDNGQSLVLGGSDGKGGEISNDLTLMALKASKDNLLIDPKINLRVSPKTPMETFILGTELTKAGLGFPQYSNDDIVIPYLEKLGYDKEDAQDYVTAACWEFIIPNVGMDIPNIKALSFPLVIDRALHKHLENCGTYTEFEDRVRDEIQIRLDELCADLYNLKFSPAPLTSLCLHSVDVRKEYKYYNFGIHGTGVSTAADSLTAIKKYVFDEKSMTAKEYVKAVDSDFEGYGEFLHKLRFETAKMGQNDDEADSKGVMLLNCFADCLEGKKNSYGGIYRAGTGSAMFYLRHPDEIGASPDGRRKGEPFGANFSPGLFTQTDGPMSVIASFVKPELSRVCNGGPLTLEFHSGVFDSDDAIEKVAALVKAYIDMGGHQLQLNAVNLETLLKAQKNPDKYSNLIVRIWGWSAYFTELDKGYQDHVIARQEYRL